MSSALDYTIHFKTSCLEKKIIIFVRDVLS